MGRAKRRREENRRRRHEEARATERTRAGRRRALMIVLPTLAAVAAVTVLLALGRDPAGEEATPTAGGTASTVAMTADSVPEPELESDAADQPDEPVDTSAPPQAEGSERPAADDTTVPSAVTPPEGCPAPDGSDGPRLDFEGPQPMCINPAARYTAVFDTSEGEMRFDLAVADTPGTVNNFVTLARWGYYDGTLLFRTDPSIDIIQGGSPHTNSPSDPGPGYNIPDEPSFTLDPDTGQPVGPYRYQPGQLVMARSAGFDSGGAQFFITTGPDAAFLDSQGVYVVFGATDEAGLDVARSIMDLHVSTGALGGAPSRDVIVHSVTIVEAP